MGRTAKYKKIKSFDPYSKQNGGRIALENVGIWGLGNDGRKAKKKSKTVQKLKEQKLNRLRKKAEAKGKTLKVKGQEKDGFDLAPSDNEDDFDMADIGGSVKKQKPLNPSELIDLRDEFGVQIQGAKATEKAASNPVKDAELEAKEAQKLLKLDIKNSDTSGEQGTLQQGRMENESKRAYSRRVKAETRQIIKQNKIQDRNPEKLRKKKEFLNMKKKKKRSKGQSGKQSDNSDDSADFRRVEEIPFGTQAERPPTFKALPRGVRAKQGGKKKDGKKSIKSDAEIEAEQKNLEKMRQKVQEQYAIIKAKRKRAGDFHL